MVTREKPYQGSGMIHYQLRCNQAHGFDGWFKDSTTFEKQAKLGLIECPECGDTNIDRALMAPAVATRDEPAAPRAEVPAPAAPDKVASGRMPAQMLAMLQRMRAEVEKNCDYVGPAFADEARKMHRGQTEHRAIYGETSPSEAESLADEGIEFSRIPWVPRADG
jgi:hypothetical protein